MGSDECFLKRKKDTNRNLARVTPSPGARRSQSLMDVSVEEREIEVFEECPNVRDLVK